MQAVIAARRYLGTTRLEFSTPPNIVSVEEMNLTNANRRAGFPGAAVNDVPGDTKVWLVIFEGDYRIVPPDPMHTLTPNPPGHGCSAVIILANIGLPSGIGTLGCPSLP